jgi:hypothetical protein
MFVLQETLTAMTRAAKNLVEATANAPIELLM